MEIKTQVQTYRIEKQCDKCKDGRMEWYMSYDKSWGSERHVNKCDKCDNEKWLDKKYPMIIYEK